MKLIAKFFPLIVIVLLVLAFFFNPDKSHHVDAIFKAKIDLVAEDNVKNKTKKKVNKLSTSKPARAFKKMLLNYHDYYLFSYTTAKFTKKKVTYGFLGLVFTF